MSTKEEWYEQLDIRFYAMMLIKKHSSDIVNSLFRHKWSEIPDIISDKIADIIQSGVLEDLREETKNQNVKRIFNNEILASRYGQVIESFSEESSSVFHKRICELVDIFHCNPEIIKEGLQKGLDPKQLKEPRLIRKKYNPAIRQAQPIQRNSEKKEDFRKL